MHTFRSKFGPHFNCRLVHWLWYLDPHLPPPKGGFSAVSDNFRERKAKIPKIRKGDLFGGEFRQKPVHRWLQGSEPPHPTPGWFNRLSQLGGGVERGWGGGGPETEVNYLTKTSQSPTFCMDKMAGLQKRFNQRGRGGFHQIPPLGWVNWLMKPGRGDLGRVGPINFGSRTYVIFFCKKTNLVF